MGFNIDDYATGPALNAAPQAPPPVAPAKSPGFLQRIVGGLVHAPKAFLNTDVINPVKETAAELTGNKKAEQNAIGSQFPGAKNAGQALKQVGGNTAQLGSFLIPGAEEGGVLAKAGVGAARGALFGGGAAAADNKNIVKGAVTGGVTGAIAEPLVGGILGKVLGKAAPAAAEEPVMNGVEELTGDTGNASKAIAAQPEKETNLFQNLAKSIQKGVVNPKIEPSPFASGTQDQLVQYLKDNNLIKAGDSASSIYSKLQGHFTGLQSQIADKLANDSTSTSVGDLSQKIEDAVNNNNRFGGTNNAAQTALENTKNILAKAADENGNLDSKTIYSLKNQVQDELGRAFDKISKNAPLTGNEDALMSIRNTLNDALPDEVKQLGKNQSMLYDASPGLAKNASQAIPVRTPTLLGTLPGTRIPSQGLSNVIQGAKTGTAAGLEKVGDIANNVGGAVKSAVDNPVGSAIRTGTEAAVVPAAVSANTSSGTQDTQAGQTPAPTDTTEAPSTSDQPTNSFGISKEQVAQGMVSALANGDTKSFSTLRTLYGLINAEDKANNPSATLISKSTAANSALSGLQTLSDAFSKTNLTGKGILSKLVGDSPLGGSSVKDINDKIPEIAASVAKAVGAGSSKDIMSALPSVTDSPKTAQAKIDSLKNQIAQYLQDQQDQDNQTSQDSIAQLVGATQ